MGMALTPFHGTWTDAGALVGGGQILRPLSGGTYDDVNDNILQPSGEDDGNYVEVTAMTSLAPITPEWTMDTPSGAISILRCWVLCSIDGDNCAENSYSISVNGSEKTKFELTTSDTGGWQWFYHDYSDGWASVSTLLASHKILSCGAATTLKLGAFYIEAL